MTDEPSAAMSAALARAHSARASERVEAAAVERDDFLTRYPRESLASLALEDYVLGHHEDKTKSFCWWLEHGTRQFGGIGGGNSQKFVIFKRRATGEFEYPSEFSSAEEAWEATRRAIVRALDLAADARWEEIDEIKLLRNRSLMRLKIVALYFPDELLPISAPEHIVRFMRALRLDNVSQSAVVNNRRLFHYLRSVPEIAGLEPPALIEFLYAFEDVGSKPDGRLRVRCDDRAWERWRSEGVAEIMDAAGGDLSQISGADDLRDLLEHGEPRTPHAVTRLMTGLKHVVDDEPGTLVVANSDRQTIRGVGLLTGGYSFAVVDGLRCHQIGVRWLDGTDHQFSASRLSSGEFGEVTVFDLPPELLALEDPAFRPEPSDAPVQAVRRAPSPKPHLYDEVRRGLMHRGQVVLYGPPGTGKTHLARQMAVRLVEEDRGEVPSATEHPSALAGSEERLGQTSADHVAPITRLTFHPSYGYEDFVEGWRPVEDASATGLSLKLRDGTFKRVCDAAAKEPDRHFVVLIDEINRANVARVFGELITVLELDKRGVAVTLPSGRPFSIPKNLWVIGTMNSADRSVRSIDIALRRRFAFVEMLPNPDRLRSAEVDGLVLGDLLEALNERLVARGLRDQQIGHAFFFRDGTAISEIDTLAQVIRHELIPLLQEYCFDDYGALASLLGDQIVDTKRQRLHDSVVGDAEELVQALRASLVPDAGAPVVDGTDSAGAVALSEDE